MREKQETRLVDCMIDKSLVLSLDGLDVGQLRELKFLINEKLNKDSKGSDSSVKTFYEIITKVLFGDFGIRVQPYSVFVKSNGCKILTDAKDCIDQFVGVHIQDVKKIELLSLYDTIVRLAISKIVKLNINLNVKSVLNFCKSTYSLIDEAYPGYLASGMFAKVLRK